jgi:hypothetical protein
MHFPFRKIPDNLYSYSTLTEMGHNSVLLECGICFVNFSKVWEFLVEKSNEYYFRQFIQVNVNIDVMLTAGTLM